MSTSPQGRGLDKLHFDVYEVDPRAGELRRDGYRVPLEDRPFRALQILLQNAPDVVTREELQKHLWPADVFIDFDHGLNKAIGKVRRALNDRADKPRFVETVGSRGYRFIAPLAPAEVQEAAAVEIPASSENRTPHHWHGQPPFLVAATVIVISLFAYLFRPEVPKPFVASIVQLTKSGEAWPLEPMATDGPRLYYQSFSSSSSAATWQVRQVLLNGNEETAIPGTSDMVHSFRIRGLSADDTEFLALSRVDALGEQWMAATLPVVGGLPRRVSNLVADDIAWSHDGNAFVYSRGNQLFLSNPDGTGSRPLATLQGHVAYMSWSPDDHRIGFTVLTERQALWEIGADGRGLHERRLDWPGKAMECCGAWTPDGRYFVFRSRREGVSNLWAVHEKSQWWRRGNREPVQLTFGPMNYYQPLPARNGKAIFAVGTLRSGELCQYDAKQKDFVTILRGMSADHLEFSRDGKRISYVTVPERTLWWARSDGSKAFQLTFPPLQVDSRPHWSPDGKRITFAAKRPGELLRLYTISLDEGTPVPLPTEGRSQATPDWMPEENALIYGGLPHVDEPGVIALYRIDVGTGRGKRIPGTDGLYNPIWSPDGRQLAALDAASQRLFLVDINSGKRTQLSHPAVYPVWSADSRYLYFSANDHEIVRVRVPDGQEQKVLNVPFRLASASFGLGPDGSPIVLREHGRYDVYALSLGTQ